MAWLWHTVRPNVSRGGRTVLADLYFGNLRRYLELLDSDLMKIKAAIVQSMDPDSDGLLDNGEYIIGTGLVAVQHQMDSLRCTLKVKKSVALKTSPFVNTQITFFGAVNAGANYWKHNEEWFSNIFSDDCEHVKVQDLNTRSQLEKVTPWEDYTCANLLAILVDEKELKQLKLSALLPRIVEWRKNLCKGQKLA